MKPEKMLYIILHFLFILKKTHISPPVWPRPKYRGSKMNIGKTRLYRDFYSHRIFLKHLFWFFWSVARSLSRARLKDTKSCLDPDLDDFQNISIHLKVGQCQRTGAAFFFYLNEKNTHTPITTISKISFYSLVVFSIFSPFKIIWKKFQILFALAASSATRTYRHQERTFRKLKSEPPPRH